MSLIQQILFVIVAGFAIWLFTKNILKIRRNILLGRDEPYNDQPGRRWKNLLLLAFGQKVMFRYPLVAFLHFLIYAGFIIINIEVLEIIIDGIAGTHRVFMPLAPALYSFLINAFEFLALAVLLSCVVFLVRRNILKLRRFISRDLRFYARLDERSGNGYGWHRFTQRSG